jgi:DNA modification methylase
MGFEKFELDFYPNEEEKDNDIPELKIKTDIKKGDIYKLGRHRIICGDSTDINVYEQLMNGKTAKLIFTSPPYNMGGGMYQNYKDNMQSEEYINFNMQVVKNCNQYLKGFLFWNVSYNKNSRWEFLEIMSRIVREAGLKFLELIVWDKGHGMPITSKEMITRRYEDILLAGNDDDVAKDLELFSISRNFAGAYFNKKTNHGITNYWKIDTNNTQLENHKACYPVGLPTKGIMLMTDKQDIVLDPFLGSGTTLIACEKTGRIGYGIELDPIYCQQIIDRFEKFTGLKAEKVL